MIFASRTIKATGQRIKKDWKRFAKRQKCLRKRREKISKPKLLEILFDLHSSMFQRYFHQVIVL